MELLRKEESVMDKFLIVIGVIVLVIIVVLLAWALTGFLLMWAWNLAVVPLFGLPIMNFAQGFGLAVILGLIGASFKSVNSKK